MSKPFVSDAPGLTWKPRKRGWEARWQARSDIIRKGWPVKSRKLAVGMREPLSEIEIADIQTQCQILQNEMTLWAAGGVPWEEGFNGTLRSLIDNYLHHEHSSFQKIRYNTRGIYENKLRRLTDQHGHELVREIKAVKLIEWHKKWTDNGLKVAAGHSMIGMLRTLMTFGATILDDETCLKVKTLLGNMKFENTKPRDERLTAQQAIAIRAVAHKKGRHSIALAQAFQFECMLRQKDVIGELVPVSEPGPLGIVVDGNRKWMRGIRWNEIDADLILRHVTSKRQKLIEIDLKGAPMVMEELSRYDTLPADGPIIISERTEMPYDAVAFRRQWREIATAAGVPPEVRNMDSRAGGASEATDAGAQLEDLRHAMTHSQTSMTARYSRGSAGKIATVQNLRVQHRNKGPDK